MDLLKSILFSMKFHIKNTVLTLFLCWSGSFFALGQNGYEISVKIDGFDQKECYLGLFLRRQNSI